MIKRSFHLCLSRTPVLAALLLSAAGTASAVDPATVWDHVHRHYVHGLPYAATEDLGRDAVPFLLAMLDDPQEEEWWYNVVLALGIVGEDEVTEPLIRFFEQWKTGEMTKQTFYAITTVPAALGFVAAKGDAPALEFVLGCTRVGRLEEAGVDWRTAGRSPAEVRVLLAQIAVKGLAYSGDPDALEYLRDMLQRPESPTLAQALEPDLREAIEIHQQITSSGPRSFFRMRR